MVVCGSLHLDVVVNAPHLPQKDETVVGTSVNYVCGGKGCNQAVAAALNGSATTMIGCIGSDTFGNQLRRHLQRNNIDCSGLQVVSDASGMSVAVVDKSGEYGAVIVSGSNLNISSRGIAFPETTGILLLQNEIPEKANIEFARQAKKNNIPIMLNAAPYRTIPTNLESLIDILILNRVEAEHYFSTDFTDTADVVEVLNQSRSSVELIIVTLGEDGLVYRHVNEQVQKIPACAIKVNSAHGAGDMFCGSLASRIIVGENTRMALEYASAAAAWYVSSALAERSTIDRQAIDNLSTANYH